MTQDQLDTIIRMRAAGKSCAVIGRKIGMSEGTVRYHCRRNGIPAKPHASAGKAWPAPRGGRRPFTAEDDVSLIAMESAGYTASQIARQLGRNPCSIAARLTTLALRDEMSVR